MPDKSQIEKIFGNHLRVRVCGICLKDDSLLLINHKGLGEDEEFWAPPGGGMTFGTSAEENLKREFKEETGLIVKVNNFLFINEFLGKPLHALELFFAVEIIDGILKKGYDPEMNSTNQIIKEVKFLKWEELKSKKKTQYHNIFNCCSGYSEIFNLKGYFKFENNYIK